MWTWAFYGMLVVALCGIIVCAILLACGINPGAARSVEKGGILVQSGEATSGKIDSDTHAVIIQLGGRKYLVVRGYQCVAVCPHD